MTRRLALVGAALACVVTGGCAQRGADGRAPAEVAGLREAFPRVRIDTARRTVEFDAYTSPMLAPDPRAPRFYFEVLCCSPQTREHETIFVTDARPSDIHAALLAIGLRPGEPGGFRREDRGVEAVHPSGDRVEVRYVPGAEGDERERDPLECIVNARDGSRFLDEERAWASADARRPRTAWVFAGSRIVRTDEGERYDADGAGVVVGLTTFGSEVIGWSRAISPDSAVQAPEWIADFSRTPPAGTPVRVRIRPAP